MYKTKFTIVAPIKDEILRLKRSLPYFYKIGADEVLICTDDPPQQKILNAVVKIAKNYSMEDHTKVIPVARNPEYKYHQAWVRRYGFRQAKNNVIVTSDIDLYLNKNILHAVDLVGQNNVGLVSLSKFRHPFNLETFFRAFGYVFLRIMYASLLKHIPSSSGFSMTLFTGLYVLYRPFWLDSEDEKIKDIIPPFHKASKDLKTKLSDFNMGEDTYLRDCMAKKHITISLSRVGAVVMDREKHYHPKIQFERGRYNAKQKRSLLGALVHTVIHVEPNYLRGFLFERRRIGN